MEIKVVQVNFALKVDRSGETGAHIAWAAWGVGGRGGAAVKGKEGDNERKERLNDISKPAQGIDKGTTNRAITSTPT